MTYTIYGAGDPGTAEIRALCFARGVAIEFRDIRERKPDGARPWLVNLLARHLPTVPQVWAPDGSYLGDFEAAERHLRALPPARIQQDQTAIPDADTIWR